MSSVSLTVARPLGRALIIGSTACRSAPLGTLQRLGFGCAEAEDPYSAMAELCRRPLAYRAMVLSLASLYREELLMIRTIKQRWPHVEVWLTQTDGRLAALADAMRYGADGLLSDDGLHRTGVATVTNDTPSPRPQMAISAVAPPAEPAESDPDAAEPILTADELRALLSDPISLAPEEPV